MPSFVNLSVKKLLLEQMNKLLDFANNHNQLVKGPNWYQKVVDQNGARNFEVYQTTTPKNLLLKGYICRE